MPIVYRIIRKAKNGIADCSYLRVDKNDLAFYIKAEDATIIKSRHTAFKYYRILQNSLENVYIQWQVSGSDEWNNYDPYNMIDVISSLTSI